jgi:hypothetical protein
MLELGRRAASPGGSKFNPVTPCDSPVPRPMSSSSGRFVTVAAIAIDKLGSANLRIVRPGSADLRFVRSADPRIVKTGNADLRFDRAENADFRFVRVVENPARTKYKLLAAALEGQWLQRLRSDRVANPEA